MTERLTVVEGYLDELSGALRVSGRRRERILAEAAAHLRDVTEGRVRSGLDMEAAQREAVARFGPAEQVAAQFNAQRPRWWHPLGRLEPAGLGEPVVEEERTSSRAARLRRRWWIVALVTVVAAAGGVVYARHRPTPYRSTSEVVYDPQKASLSQTANGPSATGNWGRDRVDMASTAAFAGWVMIIHKWPHSAADVDRLMSHFTVSATAAGNGLVFTVTYPDKSSARRLATELANGFPQYLQEWTPTAKLLQLESAVKTIQLQISDPNKYGPFLKTPQGATVRDPATGAPVVDHRAVALLPVTLQLAQNNIEQYLASQPSPEVATSTIVNPASLPAQVRPALARPVATAALIGLVLGILLALTLPRPPRPNEPVIDLQS